TPRFVAFPICVPNRRGSVAWEKASRQRAKTAKVAPSGQAPWFGQFGRHGGLLGHSDRHLGAEKRKSQMGKLAEGEELSSNPLRAFFDDLRTTHKSWWMLPKKSWATLASLTQQQAGLRDLQISAQCQLPGSGKLAQRPPARGSARGLRCPLEPGPGGRKRRGQARHGGGQRAQLGAHGLEPPLCHLHCAHSRACRLANARLAQAGELLTQPVA